MCFDPARGEIPCSEMPGANSHMPPPSGGNSCSRIPDPANRAECERSLQGGMPPGSIKTEVGEAPNTELESQLAEARDTIASLQAEIATAASVSTPACVCAEGNGLGDGAVPQGLGATANEDILRKQCQDDHAACLRRIRRGSNRVKAKKRNACNHARMGPSGIQGTCQ